MNTCLEAAVVNARCPIESFPKKGATHARTVRMLTGLVAKVDGRWPVFSLHYPRFDATAVRLDGPPLRLAVGARGLHRPLFSRPWIEAGGAERC